MKMRRTRIEVSDAQERELVEAVRRLEHAKRHEQSAPPAAYFANLLVRTNERIDQVTSGRALSISWLARVAIPGVVAILFFFVGLHYYGPQSMKQQSMTEVVNALRAQDIDSMLVEAAAANEAFTSDYPDVFSVPADQLAEFYLSSGSSAEVLESLSDVQAKEIALILESRSITL